MSERVPAWAESDERYPEREAEWRAAIARAERAEAQLAALREAAADVRVAFDDLSVPHRVAVERHAVLAAALADTAAAAEAYRASVEAPLRAEIERLTAERDEARSAHDEMVMRCGEAADYMNADDVRVAKAEAERDALAAALVEVREREAAHRAALVEVMRLTHEPRRPGDEAQIDALEAAIKASSAASLSFAHALTALPADLAAERYRRVRAGALESAADAIEDPATVHPLAAYRAWAGWLRARAADERGGGR